MTKRRFEGKELALATKSLENLKQERQWYDYQIQYYELMLTMGLEQNYKKNIRDFKVKKKEFEEMKEMNEKTIKILQEQIRDGVEIVEDKDKLDVKGGKE